MVRKYYLDDCKQKNGKTFYAVGFLKDSQEAYWGYGTDPISAIRKAYEAAEVDREDLLIRCCYGDNLNMDVDYSGNMEFLREPPIPVGLFRVTHDTIVPVEEKSTDCPMTSDEWINSIHEIIEQTEWTYEKI